MEGMGNRLRHTGVVRLVAWAWHWYWRVTAVQLDPADHARYRETAYADTRMIARHWAFRTAVGITTVIATVVGAEDTSISGFPKVLLLVVAAGVGGWVICWVLTFLACLELAPHRQRVHARSLPGYGQMRRAGKRVEATAELEEGQVLHIGIDRSGDILTEKTASPGVEGN
jgi:hypothetical protein